MTDLMNELMNYEAVCRTAPATPGLSKKQKDKYLICKTLESAKPIKVKTTIYRCNELHTCYKKFKRDINICTKKFHKNHFCPNGLHLHGFWNSKNANGSHQENINRFQ